MVQIASATHSVKKPVSIKKPVSLKSKKTVSVKKPNSVNIKKPNSAKKSNSVSSNSDTKIQTAHNEFKGKNKNYKIPTNFSSGAESSTVSSLSPTTRALRIIQIQSEFPSREYSSVWRKESHKRKNVMVDTMGTVIMKKPKLEDETTDQDVSDIDLNYLPSAKQQKEQELAEKQRLKEMQLLASEESRKERYAAIYNSCTTDFIKLNSMKIKEISSSRVDNRGDPKKTLSHSDKSGNKSKPWSKGSSSSGKLSDKNSKKSSIPVNSKASKSSNKTPPVSSKAISMGSSKSPTPVNNKASKVPNKPPAPVNNKASKVPNKSPTLSNSKASKVPDKSPTPSNSKASKIPNKSPTPSNSKASKIPNKSPTPSNSKASKASNKELPGTKGKPPVVPSGTGNQSKSPGPTETLRTKNMLRNGSQSPGKKTNLFAKASMKVESDSASLGSRKATPKITLNKKTDAPNSVGKKEMNAKLTPNTKLTNKQETAPNKFNIKGNADVGNKKSEKDVKVKAVGQKTQLSTKSTKTEPASAIKSKVPLKTVTVKGKAGSDSDKSGTNLSKATKSLVSKK